MSVHPTAIVSPLATIDPSANIGPYAIIDGAVRIGADCQIATSAVVLGNTEIGPGCRIHAHAVVGDVPQDHAYHGDESYLRIGENCVIREGATIHRGTGAGTTTIVGNRCHLMTNSHVGHNCTLGDDVTLISGVLLGGHVQIGARAVIGGATAIHQFVRIGELAMVSGCAKVVQDVPPFFMTDREGAIVGENRVGFLRAGVTRLERDEIKTAFRIIYRSGMGRDVALEELRKSLSTTAGLQLLKFMEAGSKRGVRRESIPLRKSA